MPGYNVVGIDCDSPNEDIISLSGAIHCITHSVGVADPLMISHLPLEDTEDTENSYGVVADISTDLALPPPRCIGPRPRKGHGPRC